MRSFAFRQAARTQSLALPVRLARGHGSHVGLAPLKRFDRNGSAAPATTKADSHPQKFQFAARARPDAGQGCAAKTKNTAHPVGAQFGETGGGSLHSHAAGN